MTNLYWDLSTPPRQKNEKFQQLTEFERGRIISLWEGGFSYCTIASCLQWNSSRVTRIWKQWTDEHWTIRKTGSGRWKAMSASNGRHLLHMVVNGRRASSRQLAARWCTATGVIMSVLSIRQRLMHRGLSASVPLYRIPLRANQRWLPLQWADEHRAWQPDWHQVVFSDESHFKLWDHGSHVHDKCYTNQCLVSEYIIEQHSDRTSLVMVWGAILYHGWSNLLQILGYLNSNRYVHEVL